LHFNSHKNGSSSVQADSLILLPQSWLVTLFGSMSLVFCKDDIAGEVYWAFVWRLLATLFPCFVCPSPLCRLVPSLNNGTWRWAESLAMFVTWLTTVFTVYNSVVVTHINRRLWLLNERVRKHSVTKHGQWWVSDIQQTLLLHD
jgi:hypothetical protein